MSIIYYGNNVLMQPCASCGLDPLHRELDCHHCTNIHTCAQVHKVPTSGKTHVPMSSIRSLGNADKVPPGEIPKDINSEHHFPAQVPAARDWSIRVVRSSRIVTKICFVLK